MDEVVRVILSCRNRRQAFQLGKALLLARLASGMSVGADAQREAWESGCRSPSDVPLVLSTLVCAVPFLEAKVLEMHPYDPPPFVACFGEPAVSPVADFVRSQVLLPVIH